MLFANQQAYEDYVKQFGVSAATGANPPFGLLGVGDPLQSPTSTIPNQRFLDQYSSYGFSPELQNYLAQQAQLATTDAGIAYQYDPATQTFTGGSLGTGPMTVSMAEMMQKANLATNQTANPSVAFAANQMPSVNTSFSAPSLSINSFNPMQQAQQPMISNTKTSATPINFGTQFPQPFNPLSYMSQGTGYEQLQGVNNQQFFQPFNYFQQPNLYGPFSNPFAMRPMFEQLGLTGLGGTRY